MMVDSSLAVTVGGVRGDGGRDSGSGILIGTVADREDDGMFDTTDVAVRSLVRSLVTRCVLRVDTGSPEDSVVQREASLLTGGQFAVNGEKVLLKPEIPGKEPARSVW